MVGAGMVGEAPVEAFVGSPNAVGITRELSRRCKNEPRSPATSGQQVGALHPSLNYGEGTSPFSSFSA